MKRAHTLGSTVSGCSEGTRAGGAVGQCECVAVCPGAVLGGSVCIGAACVCVQGWCTCRGRAWWQCAFRGSSGVCMEAVLDGSVRAGARGAAHGRQEHWAGSVCGSQTPTTLSQLQPPRCCPHRPARTHPGCACARGTSAGTPLPALNPACAGGGTHRDASAQASADPKLNPCQRRP